MIYTRRSAGKTVPCWSYSVTEHLILTHVITTPFSKRLAWCSSWNFGVGLVRVQLKSLVCHEAHWVTSMEPEQCFCGQKWLLPTESVFLTSLSHYTLKCRSWGSPVHQEQHFRGHSGLQWREDRGEKHPCCMGGSPCTHGNTALNPKLLSLRLSCLTGLLWTQNGRRTMYATLN